MTSATTAKMSHNSNVSAMDRDALRKQQRQERAAQLLENKDTDPLQKGLFAGPICIGSNTVDPITSRIQKTLGHYENFKGINPKNLIGIASQPQTPLPTAGGNHFDGILSQSGPLFAEALKQPKPPYPNGQVKGMSGSSGSVNHHLNNHHRVSSNGGNSNSSGSMGGGSSNSNSRSNNVSSGSTGTAPGPRTWNSSSNPKAVSQVKQPTTDSYSVNKQKASSHFKSISPVPQMNHGSQSQESLTVPVPATVARDQCSPARTMDRTKSGTSAFLPQPIIHKSSSSSASSASTPFSATPTPTSNSKSNSIDHPRMNGTILNGAIKPPGYNRHSAANKHHLRLHIEENAKVNQADHAEVESILKEMIAPTPLTAIPTPRKDETKFAFAPVSNHQLAKSPSTDRSAIKNCAKSLEKAFNEASAPPTVEKSRTSSGSRNSGVNSVLNDLEISEDSDDEVETQSRKPPAVQVRPNGINVSPANSAVDNQRPASSDSSSSDSEDSSSSSDSEDNRKSHSEQSEDEEAKPQPPKNWNLGNFVPALNPFGLPSDVALPAIDASASSRSTNSSGRTSANKNVCDPSNNSSSRQAAKSHHVNVMDSDDDDEGLCPVPEQDLKSFISTSPPRDSLLTNLGKYHKKDEAFSKVMENVPTISQPLSPSSPPSSRSASSSLTNRKRPPAAAAMISSSSSQSRDNSLVKRELKDKISSKRKAINQGHLEKDRHKSGQSPRVMHKKSNETERSLDTESMTKDKFRYGGLTTCDNLDISWTKDDKKPSMPKRPHTPAGTPPPSPPVVVAASSAKQSSKSSGTPTSSSCSSKPSGTPAIPKSNSASAKGPSKSEAKETESAGGRAKKSPSGKKTKSSVKYTSKELISSDTDSDSDSDARSTRFLPPTVSCKTPTFGASGSVKTLSKARHFSSSTSLSSNAESMDDVSTGNSKSKSISTHSTSIHTSSARKEKKPRSHESSSKSSSSNRESSSKTSKSTSSSSSNKIGNFSSLAEELVIKSEPLSPIPEPLSSLSKNDLKEERTKLSKKEFSQSVPKQAPLNVEQRRLIVKIKLKSLERIPVYPPNQLRLTSDGPAKKSSEPLEKKIKSEHKSLKSENKCKGSQEGEKENSQAGYNNNAHNKTEANRKRKLQEAEAAKPEAKKAKKEKEAPFEGFNQPMHKSKLSPAEKTDNVKIKREEFPSEDIMGLKSSTMKNSPVSHLSQSPANRMVQSPAELKSKRSSSTHKSSDSSKRDKKHTSSSSHSSSKKEKSSRENELLKAGDGENDTSRLKKSSYDVSVGASKDGNVSAAPASALTAPSIAKDSKQRSRDSSDVSAPKKKKYGGSASQENSVSSLTESKKAITSDGIERNTNHDRILSSNDFNSNHSSNPFGFTSSSSKDSAFDKIVKEIDFIKSRPSDDILLFAKTIKHEADKEANRTLQVMKYALAIQHFILTAFVKESEHPPQNSSNNIPPNNQPLNLSSSTLYANTLDFMKFILSKVRSSQSTNADKIIAVLCLYCQSILNVKLYNMKKAVVVDCHKAVSEYQKYNARTPTKQMTSPGQSSSNAVPPPTVWSNCKTNGAPSPMSPLPSPANSVGSVESQSSGYSSSEIGQAPRSNTAASNNANNILHHGSSSNGGGVMNNTHLATAASAHQSQNVSIPAHIHSSVQKHLAVLHHLYVSHDAWDQAEALISRGGTGEGGIQDFMTGLDEKCKKLTLLSSVPDLVRYVMMGLHCLGLNVLRRTQAANDS